ncbi:MAG: ABC transporter ATP-binding protein [Acidimicrobiales bacterium]|nr:ABC transporter ATP-binding protein [Acidimicrobiales bacterium]MCB9394230.1 ABC transporter ATP-binding protein [Acidimicrobiaceae bacterium]
MLIRLLRSHLRPYRRDLLIVVVLQSLQAALGLYLPRLNARIIDEGVVRGDTPFIWRMGGLMLVCTLGQVVLTIVAVYIGSRVAMAYGRDVRRDLFERVTGFSAREVGTFGAPSLITRITNDVQQVQMLVQMSLTMLVSAPIWAIGGIIMAMREDVGLSWLLFVSIPVLLLIVGNIIRLMVPEFQRMQDRIDGLNRVLREQITGMRVVRAFVREPQEAERFGEANDAVTESALKAGRLMSFMFPTAIAMTNFASVAVVWFGSNRVASGDMQVGAMVAYITYLVQILMSVMMSTFIASMWPRASVSADRIVEVLDTPSSVVAPPSPVTAMPHRATVQFVSASFGYPGAEADVLHDITFTCLPGQTTAIIGSTGSGKTTLLGLVPRLFDVTGGRVLVNGVDVRELDPLRLGEQIGLVPQKPYLFSGTVASNLRYGRPEATEDEMWHALEVAQAADFVRAMPGGLDAAIVQGGSNVSGGQRQRLAIARALVRRPDIYLFDDSFSALDVATDARLRAALRPETRDAAVLLVGQRVATIRHADQILVLEDGRIVGLGTHDDLLASCPTYQEIVESQLQTEEAA